MYILRSSLLSLLLLGSTTSLAADVYRDLNASGIGVAQRNVPAYQTITFELVNLDPGVDTVLQLVTPAGIVSNDDGPSGLGSRLTWFNPYSSPVSVTAYIHAYGSGNQGLADLAVNGVVEAPRVWIGGVRVNQTCGALRRWRAVRSTGGVSDPLLLALDSNLRMTHLDDDGGAGLDALLSTQITNCSVVVGGYGSSSTAGVDLYGYSDFGFDLDGDGLPSDLEQALGTCESPYCLGGVDVPNPWDTDLDGLSDGAEVFGVDDPSTPQYLPAWGANPLHKDMFVEVDWTEDAPDYPLSAQALEEAGRHFLVDQYNSIGNPDGRGGIDLHFDAGYGTNPPDMPTLMGFWGGAQRVPMGTDYKTAPATWRSPVRNGLFRYALATPGAGGQSQSRWMHLTAGDRLVVGYQGHAGGATVLTHELGHTVNLAHHGHDDWGEANCKPNYRSIMNYAFQYATGFSQSEIDNPLNPVGVDEAEWMLGEAGYATYLTGDPFYLRMSGEGLDFNRDGNIVPLRASPTGGVMGLARTEVNWATWVGCDTYTQNKARLTGATTAAMPALVRRGDRLYAFWVGTDQRIRYRQGAIGTATSRGSCPVSERLGEACMTWEAEQTVPTAVLAQSVTAVAEGDRVVLAWRTTTDSVRVISADRVDGAGNLTGWAGEAWVGNARTAQEVEIHRLEVNPNKFGGSSQVTAVVYRNRDDASYRWVTAPTGVGPWTARGALRDGAGRTLQGALGTSLATLPDGAASRTCGAFTDTSSRVEMYCYDKARNQWTREAGAFATTAQPKVVARPGLVFHLWRDGDGAPMFGDTTFGQFRLVVNNHEGALDVYLSEAYSRLRSPRGALTFKAYGKFADDWRKLLPGAGIELYEDPGLGALKGLYVEEGAPGDYALQFLPFADGTFSEYMNGGNDFRVMQQGLCAGLRDPSQCGY